MVMAAPPAHVRYDMCLNLDVEVDVVSRPHRVDLGSWEGSNFYEIRISRDIPGYHGIFISRDILGY